MLKKSLGTFNAHRKFFFRYTWPLKVAAYRAGRSLVRRAGKPNGEKAGAVIAVVPYYGEEKTLSWFLTYYRKLGVNFFAFLDVSAEKNLSEHLAETADCAVWAPKGFMHPGRTIHALNFLRHLYARDKWCLSVEPWDFLVFPKSETRHIRDLIDFVESEQRKHVYAIVVDAYGDGPVTQCDLAKDVSPFERMPYFDKFGYQTMDKQDLGVVPIFGGVQRRSLYGDEPQRAPALNRIPLLKLHWDCYYMASTRVMVPPRLNTAHTPWHSSTTACLLRYAMLSDEMAFHIAKQAESGQLYPDSVTTMYPGSEAMSSVALKNQGSGTYRSSQDLLDCGLLNNGQWF